MESKKDPFEFAKKWIDETYNKISTKTKFLKLIKSLGEEYNEQTKSGWQQNGNYFKFLKEGKETDSSSLNMGGLFFDVNGKLQEISSQSKEIDLAMARSTYLKTPYFIIRKEYLSGFSKTMRFDGYEPKLKLELQNQKDSISIHDFFKNKIKELNKGSKPEEVKEKKETQPIVETVKFGHEWIEKNFDKVSSKEAFKAFIKEHGEEYNKETRTGWQCSLGGAFTYYKNNVASYSNSLGIHKAVFDETAPVFFELLAHGDKDNSIKPRCVEYNKSLNGFTIQSYDNAIGNVSYKFYDFKTKEFSKEFSDRTKYYDSIYDSNKREKEIKTKSYTLNIESFKELYPNLSTVDKFKAFIKERGEEYNEKSKTGWVFQNGRFCYLENGKPTIPGLGFDQISFNKNNGALIAVDISYSVFYKLNPSPDGFLPIKWISSKNCQTELVDENHFLCSRQSKDATEVSYQIFNKNTNELSEISTKRYDLLKNYAEKIQKKETKTYTLGIESFKELYPNFSTLDKFKAFIKERGEEYNKETKTGWYCLISGDEFIYHENGKVALPKLGFSRIRFINGDFALVDINVSLLSENTLQPKWIVSRFINGELTTNDNFLISYQNASSANSTFKVFDIKTTKILEESDNRTDVLYNFKTKLIKNETKEKKMQEKPAERIELGPDWIEKFYHKIDNFDKFISYIKENKLEFNQDTQTGWMHDGTRFEYYKNGKSSFDNELSVFKVAYSSKTKKLSFAEEAFHGKEKEDLERKIRIISTNQQDFTLSEDDFLFVKTNSTASNPSFVIYDSKSKKLSEEFSLRTPSKIQEVLSGLKAKPMTENKVDKKVYELGPELIKELFPQIDTLGKFKSFIKERGEEYDEKTGTGWKFTGTFPVFYKNDVVSISSLGFSQASFTGFFGNQNLRYVEISGDAFDRHYTDKTTSQIRWIETKTNLTELRDDSRYLIAKDKPGQRDSNFEFQVYDKTRDVLLGKATDKFVLMSKINKIQVLKENKDIELLSLKTLDVYKNYFATKEAFEDFLNLSDLRYNNETKTGWMETSLDIFAFYDKGKAVVSCFGFDAIEFDGTKKVKSLNLSREAFSNLEKEKFEKHQESYVANLEINSANENEVHLIFKKYDTGTIKYQIYNKTTKTTFEGSSKPEAEEKRNKVLKEYVLDETWIKEIYPQLETLDKFKALVKERGEEYNTETGFGWRFDKNSAHSFAKFYKNRQRDNSALGIAEISFSNSSGEFRWANGIKSNVVFAETYDEDLKIDPEQKFINIATGNSNSVYTSTGKLVFKFNSPQKLKAVLKKYKTAFQRKEAVVLDQKWIDDVQSEIDTLEKFREYIKEYPPIDGKWKEDTYDGNSFSFIKHAKTTNDKVLGIAYISFDKNGKLNYTQKVTDFYTDDEIEKNEIVLGIVQPRFEGLNSLEDPSIYKIQTVIPNKNRTSYTKLNNYLVNSLTNTRISLDGKDFFVDLYKKEYDLNKELRANIQVNSIEELHGLSEDFKGICFLKNRDYQKVMVVSNEEIGSTATGCFYNKNWNFLAYYKNGKLHREDGPACENINGTKEWYIEGKLHREDGPAIEFGDGNKEWYKEGLKHREDGPAIEFQKGYKEWWIEGKRHREDGPAIEFGDGTKNWYKEGLMHREDGPAVEGSNGSKLWHKKGHLHREDGPAVEYSDGGREWYKEGNLHREDGPAIELANDYKEWWINGKKLTKKEIEDLQFKLVAPKLAKVKSIAESDAREVAKRIAANQIARFIQMILSNSIKLENTSKSLNKLIDSIEGRAFIKLAASGAIPILKQHMLPKYHEVLDELSEEFRIQGETDIATSVIDKVISSISSIPLLNFQNNLERIRIEVDKPLTLINSPFEEEEEIKVSENNFSAAKN